MITKRLLSTQVVLLAGFGTIFLLPDSNKYTPAGIAMKLPTIVGAWIGDDAEVTQREREVLAKDTEFARKMYIGPQGDRIFVSIVLSGDDMASSIHRPERCLVAQGWSVRNSEKRILRARNGKSLEATQLHNVHTFELPDKSSFLLHNFNYYWFIGSKQMTSSHLVRTGIDLRDRILRGEAQRWAYVTVAIDVTEGLGPRGRDQAESQQIVEQFIGELLPKLTRPDGKPLL